MPHRHMNHEYGPGNVYMTIVTTILLFIARFTLSDGAAIAAIFAGVTTGAYNIYKFIKDRKTKPNANSN
jgi:hypothetical protein